MAGEVARTWMWGPKANTPVLQEPYAESPGGVRDVQYFDKSRMELTHPDSGDPDSIWYVTNGLLVVEMAAGRVQVGDNTFEDAEPALERVAGDQVAESDAPSYAVIADLMDEPWTTKGTVITATVDAEGTVSSDETYANAGVTAEWIVADTEHTVASVFWEFMTSTGFVADDGMFFEGSLFPNPFYATGLPITEAYWTTIPVDGVEKDVLFQCFERRCLTYTPANEPGWQVEAGNVGQHYYRWLYELIPDEPPDQEPSPGDVPTAPSNLTAEAFDAETIRLTWTDNSDNEEGFEVSPDAANVIVEVASNTTTTDVAAGEYPCFKVRAVNSAGPSAWSEGWACAAPLGPPNVPSEITADGRIASDGSPEIVVGWQDNSDNEFEFVIYRWPEGDADQADPIAYLGMNSNGYVDEAIDFDEAWCYAVVALGQGGVSPRSNSECATVPTPE